MLDLEVVRQQFPGLDGDWTFFDNAGGSFAVRPVVERVAEHLTRFPVQLGASYPRSREAAARVDSGRRAMADWIGCDPAEIVFGSSSTLLVQILSRALTPALNAGDEIVVTNADHETNIGPWRALENHGVVVKEWRFGEDAALHVDDLLPLLTQRTRLVCFAHVSNIVGTIHDVEEICRVVRDAGAMTCVDGVAYAPHRRVDARRLGADFYFFSLYKTFGPHLALLYGRREHLLNARGQYHFFHGERDVPQKLEPGNVNYELVASLGGILDYLDLLGRNGVAGDDDAEARRALAHRAITEHEVILARALLGFLVEHPRVRLVGSPDSDAAVRVPTISFTVDGMSSAEVIQALDGQRLAARFGHFYAYRLVRDLGLDLQDGVVRVSMVHYNTEEEVARLVEALGGILPAR